MMSNDELPILGPVSTGDCWHGYAGRVPDLFGLLASGQCRAGRLAAKHLPGQAHNDEAATVTPLR